VRSIRGCHSPFRQNKRGQEGPQAEESEAEAQLWLVCMLVLAIFDWLT
jgi:hypothetical protein